MLDEGKSTEAAELYDRLVIEYPSNTIEPMIVYNAGLAYLQGGVCPKAGDRFRQVVRLSNKKIPQLQGRALLRLSDIHTCLGEDSKAVATLVQLSRDKYGLPPEISAAEIPAKLAAAYARIGNIKEAERYFKIAEKGLSRMQDGLKDADKRSELSRILFTMGNISQLNTKTMKSGDYLATIRALQKYLYKSVEMNSKTWSTQSYEMILQAYRQAWDYIDDVTVPKNDDDQISDREKKRQQVTLAQEMTQTLKSLYQERIPSPDEPEIVVKLMARLKQEETKYRNFVATNLVGTGLSREALEAQSLKKLGRVLNPDPILEFQAIQKRDPVKSSRSIRTAPPHPQE